MSVSKKRSRTGKVLDREQPSSTSKDISTPEPVPQSARKTPRWRSRKRSGNEKAKAANEERGRDVSVSEWTVEYACGGKFKPKTMFSKDEKFLFAATDKAVKVYNVLNGHCVRSLGTATGEKHKIVDFVLDPLNEFRILAVYTNARLRVYDWTDGLLITQYKLKDVPKTVTVLDNSTLLLLSNSSLRYCSLPFPTSTREEIIKLPIHELLDLKQDELDDSLIAVDPSTSTLCVASGKVIRFGTVQVKKGDNLMNRVSWRELVLDAEIVSLACSGDTLVLGEESGRIRVLFGMADAKGDIQPTETIITWHQSPVVSIQISTNGRYVLSGGGEETLMISQINSGQRQFIPRLEGDIIGINQTASGSQYSVSLASNTIKIIGAGDLETVSEISGVISPSSTITQPSSKSSFNPSSIALLQPHRPNLYINGPTTSPSSCTLQSYNLSIDRQSLRFETSRTSRTKWTGKEKRPVIEPRMTCAAFTSDGEWLATVEEWEDKYALDDTTSFEIFLKMWEWREKGWELVAKIENPHGIDGHVLDITSPHTTAMKGSEKEFVTLGSEGNVKVWRAYRSLHGNVSETIWSLYRTIGGSNNSTTQTFGGIKYSPDNSVIIAGVGGYIHLIDSSRGQVVQSLHLGQSICKLDILGCYLLCLHDNFSVFSGFDLASGQIIFSERLDRPYSSIAVNSQTSTFAIASASDSKSTITISTITLKGKVDETKISVDSAVSHLLSSDIDELAGFLFVDHAGQVGHISNQPSQHSGGQGGRKSMTTDYIVPRSKFISGRFTRMDVNGTAGKKQRVEPTVGTIREKDISRVLQMEGLDIMQMYETILQNVV